MLQWSKTMKMYSFVHKLIIYSFFALFTITPFLMTSVNYELFEYNKMMFVYGTTAIIGALWVIRMIEAKRLLFKSNTAGILLIVFLTSQFLSTVFSMDRHLSLFGYYSRLNGGLFSILSYVVLYFAFIANFPKEKIGRLITLSLISGGLVGIYGILEHFGGSISCLVITGSFNDACWVQDVQNRVFATLGQPNWMAAYVVILIPIAISAGIATFRNPHDADMLMQKSKSKTQNGDGKFKMIVFLAFSIIFYAALIFTKSRSGFLGFWAVNGLFWLSMLIRQKRRFILPFFIINFSFLIFNFFYSTPFSQLDRFTLQELSSGKTPPAQVQTQKKPSGESVIESGITESGDIRRIVWKGAVDIFRHHPIFGSGVETFALAYYQFRPVEHNMTSEWDFLYNKAHNEYLNYAATTGALGLGTYLLFIGFFIMASIYRITNARLPISHNFPKINSDSGRLEIRSIRNLQAGLFAGWLTILITNFFGFSVVLIQLFFYLIPAIITVLSLEEQSQAHPPHDAKIHIPPDTLTAPQIVLMVPVVLIALWTLRGIVATWYADTVFAQGYHEYRQQQATQAYQDLKSSIAMNPTEPFYLDEFALPTAQLALSAYEQKESTLTAQLMKEAMFATDLSVEMAPNNVNYWKTRTRIYFALSQIDDTYNKTALDSLERAKSLSPTDPKIYYNLGLIYDKEGNNDLAVKNFLEATRLKPDYRDAYLTLGIYYDKLSQKGKAKEMYEYILTKINPQDNEAKGKLEEMK